MRKYGKIFAAFILSGVLLVSLTACGLGKSRNPYEVAKDLGYDGTQGSWMSQNVGSGTEIRNLYEAAKADGYTGSFVDFLKEIGYTAKSAPGVNASLMSSVMVVSNFERVKDGLFGNSTEAYSSVGAGVIYSLDKEKGNAYIITNYHVLYSGSSLGRETIPHMSDDIDLYLYGGTVKERAVDASYVGGAMEYDIAVLKVENSNVLRDSPACAVTAADSDTVTLGETVYAVGNPNAEGFSVSSGVISVDVEYIDVKLADDSGTTSMLEMRTDAPINHGNSGGGLFNSEGMLVGIVNARSEKTGVENFGYAIPSNLALAIAQNIIDNSLINKSKGAFRAVLGVTVHVADSQGVYDKELNRAYVMQSVAVQEVSLSGAAQGKLRKGDVLYSIQVGNGRERIITRTHMLTNALFDVRKGDVVKIIVSRGMETVTVEITFDQDADFTLYK